jgi:hypothetical protein
MNRIISGLIRVVLLLMFEGIAGCGGTSMNIMSAAK